MTSKIRINATTFFGNNKRTNVKELNVSCLANINSPKQENHSVLKTLKVVISGYHIVRTIIRISNNFTKYLHADNSVDVEGQHDEEHHVGKTLQSFEEDKEKGPHLTSVVQELDQTSCSEHLHQTRDHEVVLKQRGGG